MAGSAAGERAHGPAQMTTDLRPIADVRAELGEGPSWDPSEGVLRFVDITKRRVYRYDPQTDTATSIELPQEVGAVVPRRAGGLIAAVREGIATVDEETAEFQLVAPIEADTPQNRMNDAKCDSRGRLWAGTMAFAATPHAASLYRYDPDGTVNRALEGVTISNGLGWSADDRTMYYIDSTEGIDTFEFEPESGRISGRRRLVTTEPNVGLPDGMTVDATGNIWVAIWGGGRVRQYTPAGDLKREILLPVSQVTSVAFGGPEYADLYITSARVGLEAKQLDQEPLAGACFVCQPGVQGIASNEFGG